MRSRSLMLAIALGASTVLLNALIAGCTFLVSFDDVPHDAGSDQEITPPNHPDTGAVVPDDDSGVASTTEAGAPTFPPACDTNFALATVNCGAAHVATCASALASYPATDDRTNDLVTCGGAATPTCVQHCPFGCTHIAAGFIDQCDDCHGRTDGFYCGRDLRGFSTADNDVAVQCENGHSTSLALCGANHCESTCTRGGGPRPSCCN